MKLVTLYAMGMCDKSSPFSTLKSHYIHVAYRIRGYL